jgi:polyhydroxyalkanoate synthase
LTAPQSPWQAGEQAADALGPEAGLVARMDLAGFAGSVGAVLSRAALRPDAVGSATFRFAASLARIGPAALSRWAGRDAEPPLPADPKDRRFADPAWEANPAFFALRQWYLAARRYAEDLLAAGAGDPAADAKAQLVTGLLLDAVAPTKPARHQPGGGETRLRHRRGQRGPRRPELRYGPGAGAQFPGVGGSA